MDENNIKEFYSRLELFSRSVVKIVFYRLPADGSEVEILGAIPGIVTVSGSNFCHIITCNRYFNRVNLSECRLKIVFVDGTSVDLNFNTVEEDIWLAAFFVPTCKDQIVNAVKFNDKNASEGEEVWMFGFNYESEALLVNGHVTHIGDLRFGHECPPDDLSWYGSPIFNLDNKLVGISCFHDGVTYAMDIEAMTSSLSAIFVGMDEKTLPEIIDHIKVLGEKEFSG